MHARNNVSSPNKRVLLGRPLKKLRTGPQGLLTLPPISPTIPKAFRPRSSVLVLTIHTSSKQVLDFENWYSWFIVLLCGGIFSDTSCGGTARIILA
jgi:hypothetical protein